MSSIFSREAAPHATATKRVADMVSIIIPAYNAGKTIRNCLDGLMAQDYRGEHEIIVVDDGSTDDTPEIIRTYPSVTLFQQKNAGPAAARNRGAAAAHGEIILFTDSDCTPESNWLTEMLKPFSEDDVVGVKGVYISHQKELAARFVQYEYEDKYKYMRNNKYIDFIDTYSAGFRRDIFMELKGYDTDFPVACAEDVELSFRISKKGYKMIFAPTAVVAHIHPNSFSSYLRKKYKFAYWRIVAVKKNPDKIIKDSHTPQLMKLQLLFPPAIFAALACDFLVGRFFGVIFVLLVLIFFISTIPYFMSIVSRDLLVAVLSPLVLFLRSVAQFLGVACGMFRVIRGI